MIQITDKKNCCGCNACGDVCAQGAISFKTDLEGFWYPEVDTDKCTNCGLCEKVCPVINVDQLKKNDFEKPQCFAAIHKNLEIRFDSTSGGIFSALAEQMYKQGGYVGGAIFTESFGVRHFISNDKKDLEALRSSKYLQSDAEGFYKQVRNLLKAGENVLVCGTPCQMAALRAFLMKPYENLIVVDFICRGVNSPKVFRGYLDYREEQYGGKVVYFKAKNKELGWRQLTSKLVFDNGKVCYDTRNTSPFTIGYLSTGVYTRPSCYDCQFKGLPRMADITVADFWGAENSVGKELDNDLGTSLVLINSEKGRAYFDAIQNILKKEVGFDEVTDGNPALYKPLDPPIVDRKEFYDDLNNHPFAYLVDKYIMPPTKTPKMSLKQKTKRLLSFIKKALLRPENSFDTFWKNIYYNLFCKQVKSDIFNRHYLWLTPHTILDLSPKSQLIVEGIVEIGRKQITGSRLETRVLVRDNAKLQFRGNYFIFYGADIEVFDNSELVIEGGGGMNIGATIVCGERIHLGEQVMLGRHVTIRDNNGHHFVARRGYKVMRPIEIGQHAWLCEGCTILAGAKIGDGAIISAKAVVGSAIPSFSLAVGNPAQVVDTDVYWKY